MILLEEAQKILNETSVKPKTELVNLDEAVARILAQDIISKINIPPFNKSAMDGYAVISGDPSERYKVIETIPAGKIPQEKVHPGECAKVMTGGIVPNEADRVIKRELTVEEDGQMRTTGKEKNKNVCITGEDIKKGDKVLEKAILIRPQEVGVLASMGLDKVKVFKKPKAGLISTGSELVPPGQSIKQSQIYDSNSYSLSAQVLKSGAILFDRRMVLDDPDKIKKVITEFLYSCDVLLISGGVSMGDFDYVPPILKSLGFKLHFEKVAIKPGKPTVFGTRGHKYVFGVPGNPVSAFVGFELFIRPFLCRMMGHAYEPFLISAVMKESIQRRKTQRASYIPVECREGFIKKLSYHGSAHIHALTRANALLCIPRGVREIKAGSQVHVRPI
ncbi:MAG TPA: gephyrin-like molybdotransferase Glp [Acidobacteriota bacterium]|nr:gephyrin-like molybdotransferase Glp [Acidobacteriota bacterium]